MAIGSSNAVHLKHVDMSKGGCQGKGNRYPALKPYSELHQAAL